MAGICVPKDVPDKWSATCAARAAQLNPRNVELDTGPDPHRIAVLKSKYHGRDQRVLTVSFLETTNRATRTKILAYANEWNCGISFEFTTGVGDIRISRGRGGYWSYLGTDVLSIPRGRQTMNLAGFTERTSDAEYARVVCHEFGHTLGFPHEHMRGQVQQRLDRQATYEHFRRYSGWSRATVDSQIFAPMSEGIAGTDTDEASIMAYHFPGSITKNGEPILGGDDINDNDRQFARLMYPVDEVIEPEEPEPEPVEPLPEGPEWDDNFTAINWV